MQRGYLIKKYIVLILGLCFIVPKLVSNESSLVQEEVKTTIASLAIDPHRVLRKQEEFQKIISKAEILHKIAWASGGLFLGGIAAYAIKTYCFDNEENLQRQNVGPNQEQLMFSPRDSWIIDRLREEREARSSLTGAAKRGMIDGFRLALVSFVAAFIVQKFDAATVNAWGQVKKMFGADPDELFERAYDGVRMSSASVGDSLSFLLHELDLVKVNSGTMSVSSFFFDALCGDLQALILQVEDFVALMGACSEWAGVTGTEQERALKQMIPILFRSIDELIAYCTKLEREQFSTLEQERQYALVYVRQFSNAMSKCVAMCSQVLFKQK